MEEAQELSDHIAIMDHGKIIAYFYFAFGGTGDKGGFEIPTTEVIVVNQDEAVGGKKTGFCTS